MDRQDKIATSAEEVLLNGDSVWHMVDRSGWGPGPWDGEPDKWSFKHAGLNCYVVRHHNMGYWCGYVEAVGFPSSTPTGVFLALKAHGGVNMATPSASTTAWVVGFDCGHAFDGVPTGLRSPQLEHLPMYKTFAFVRTETEELAEQIAELSGDYRKDNNGHDG